MGLRSHHVFIVREKDENWVWKENKTVAIVLYFRVNKYVVNIQALAELLETLHKVVEKHAPQRLNRCIDKSSII